ncbi:metallophosphoesterase [Tessaracoccus sp. ZS01]|uniref:metallophosphoesterase n=1 Tax=Tessaracoccus sp. ZS01 TaxID=1906324 RepID=UPI00096DBBDE|nr:metallophosphoesterase [Tessaracoccus sp. ZS01]MCG6567728.1 hypothetical protein [Tessaracoccus sp. ZS01]OMG55796.1 hypothetical protein BJN44_08895 [Tessaracoccus sp. ZS01]
MSSAFSLLVLGDTQYLFDGQRRRPEFLAETFHHVHAMVDRGTVAPVRHIIHVGDVTEHGWPEEVDAAQFALADGAALFGRPGMTIATGNHDVAHHSDDTRGPTPFGDTFGAGSALLPGTHAHALHHGPGGYSSWRVVTAADDIELGVLALDWRPSENGWRWADDVLAAHAHLPTVVVSHEAASRGALTTHGDRVRALLAHHPQAFLVLGGHEWPSTRVTTPGREYHAVNYQELPFGGAGAARIYEFDPRRGVCQVVSLCPAAGLPAIARSVEARRRLALSGADDQFCFALPETLGGRETPWQSDGLRLVADLRPDGETEFDLTLPGRFVLQVDATLPAAMQDGWQVLLARLGEAPGGSAEPLAAVSLSSENFLGWMAFTRGGETWANSHEYAPGAQVSIVVANGPEPGMWVDGDAVGRVDAHLGEPLAQGTWRWRIGAGEYGGQWADPFRGEVRRVRAWAA